jgi:ATP-binding cassette subfamily F protein 3
VVSHDRDLLNQVVDGILHVKDGRLSFFAGGYDAFVRSRDATEALAAQTAQKQEARRRHLQEFVDRFRAKASKAKQAQSRLKALERMESVDINATARRIRFDFPSPENRPSPLVTLYDVSVGYGEKTILRDLHLSLYPEDRVGLLGANGNGKTTLARLLVSTLAPSSGRIVSAGKLKVGYFAQDHLEKLDLEITATEQMRRFMADAPQDRVRAWLGRFGFEQSRAEVRVGQLSGGEKTRLSLALLAAERPNLMILDEPTNHLDMDSRSSLIDGLNRFEGAIMIISHDRTLLESTCDQLWLVENGTCAVFSGDMDDYREKMLKERSSRLRSGDDDAERNETRSSRRDQRRDAAQTRARIAPLKKAAEAAEAALESLVAERDCIDAQLSDPAVYSGPADQIASLTRRQRELAEQITSAEARWLEAGEALEEALLAESVP